MALVLFRLYCWDTCNYDSCYPDRILEGTFLFAFPSLESFVTTWQSVRRIELNWKWRKQNAGSFFCVRKDFQKLGQIKEDKYICFCLHFIGDTGSTDHKAEPVLATLIPDELQQWQARKRKVPTPYLKPVKKTQKKRTLGNWRCRW